MTQQETIELARQAGVEDSNEYNHLVCTEVELVAFAKLVAEKAIKEALAQSEKYPQIAINPEIVGYVAPQRTWVGLTDEEANKLWVSTDSSWELMMLTEAKLKDKNTQKTTGENNLS